MSMYDTTTSFGNYLNSGQSNVWDQVNALLNDNGLSGLTSWAKQTLVDYGNDISDAQFTQLIRETPEYKTRFKAIEVAKANGQPIPTEAEVIATEHSYQQVMQQAGLPSTFYDSPEDYANLIGRGVSPAELQTRVIDGYTAVRNNPMIQSQLSRLYDMGVSEGDLAAFYLDPDKATTAIERRQSAASIAARSNASGFGDLNLTQAEQLANQGVTDSQAVQGFQQLGQQRGLFQNLESESGTIDTNAGLNATFNNNADDQEKLQRRLQGRQGQFNTGGGFTSNNKGNTGIGSAN